MLLGWASNSSNHFQNSQKKYFLNCNWSILCNIFTENVVSNQAQLFDMIRADTHKWISIHIFLWYHTLCHVKHFSYDPSATQKSTMGPHYFSILNWFHKTFPEKSNRRLEDLKEKTCQNTKVIRKSPPPKCQVKSYLALLCVKRWMLLLNLHSFRLSQKSTSSGNYSRVRFWTCLSRPHRPLGGARLFCDVAELPGLVAGIHCRWLREQECSLINVPLGGNFHASSYPIDPPSSCEFAMLEFCGGYCKKS